MKSSYIINGANNFVQALSSENKMHLIQVTKEDVEDTKKWVESWEPPAVTGLLSMHSILPVQEDLYGKETSCFRECCYSPGGIFKAGCEVWTKTQIRPSTGKFQRTEK